MSRARWAVLLWALAALALLVVLLKFFVADVYRVDSGSMRPTIFGGRDRPDGEDYSERVLVVYDRSSARARSDLAVLRERDGSALLVKRVCGLPRETVAIVEGDLWIDGQRLPPDAPRPEPVPVFDDRYLDVGRWFEFPLDGSVRREGSEWAVAGAALRPGTLLYYHPELRDDYLDRRHQRVSGLCEVNDAILALDFRIDEQGGAERLRFQLVEQADTFEVVLQAGSEGGLRLVRRSSRPLATMPARASEVLLAEAPLRVEPGRWYGLSFANVDNQLSVQSAELGLDLGRSYAENERTPDRSSVRPRVAFGAEGGRARFRSIRILRDIYYTDAGTYGVASPVSLGDDEVFLLGDNSASSTDSRHFGPVRLQELLGRPVAVVWPGFHWLGAGQP